jgi:hypothetical protein
MPEKASKTRVLPNKKGKRTSKESAAPAPLLEVIPTREDWLCRAAQILLPFVRQAAAWEQVPSALVLPPSLSCSWPPGRGTGTVSMSVPQPSGGYDICISPVLGQGWEGDETADIAVLSHLVHELVHCVVGHDCGHRGAYAAVATAVGLAQPLTEPRSEPGLASQLEKQVLARLGSYPHRAVKPPSKTGGNRQRKWVCARCGRIIRCAGDLQAQHLCGEGQVGLFVPA